jgi:hypothetical protein
LRCWGFDTELALGVQGPKSLACGFLSRLALMVRRPDLVDRLYGAMRWHLLDGGRARGLAPLSLILAQKLD